MFISKEKYEELIFDRDFWKHKNIEKISIICDKDDEIRKLKKQIEEKDNIIKAREKKSYIFIVKISICKDHIFTLHIQADSHEKAAELGKQKFLDLNKSILASDIISITAEMLQP